MLFGGKFARETSPAGLLLNLQEDASLLEQSQIIPSSLRTGFFPVIPSYFLLELESSNNSSLMIKIHQTRIVSGL